MGKIMSLINITTDGFVDGRYAITDAEFFAFSHRLLSVTRTVAFGRNTFSLFQERWPSVLEKENEPDWKVGMAKVLHDKQKTVYSSTLKSTTWNNSSILQKVDAGHMKSYKQEGSGGLLTLGSLSLVAVLTEMNLIDDYYFCIQPLIAGDGERMFDMMHLSRTTPLKYVSSEQLKSGVHIVHYQNTHNN
jgi:dihydrofolate reductase